MSKSLPNCCLFLALLGFTVGPTTAIAEEDFGTSAVPFTVAPPQPIKRPQEQPAAQRASWQSYNFLKPNGGLLVYKIMADGNPACASYDGSSCLWGISYNQIDFSRLRPLVCGSDHRAKWHVTGYEDPKHWCAVARALRPSQRSYRID